MFEEGYTRLNGIQKISQKTGLPIDKCNQYRDLLANKNLVTVKQGVTKANCPKEIIKDIVNNNNNN